MISFFLYFNRMKLFNKSRFKMLQGKRLSNYIVYALGEIILVVIGILIALWINNWNKEQQIATANNDLQEKVLAQLDRDINAIEDFSKELNILDQYFLKLLKRAHDSTLVNENKMISAVLFDVKDLGLSKQSVNWIDAAQLDNSKASEMLVNVSQMYKLYFKNIDDIETFIYKKTTSNLEYLEATQSWYTALITDLNCNADCSDYLLNDPSHHARIASLRLLYIDNYAELVRAFYFDLKHYKEQLETSL